MAVVHSGWLNRRFLVGVGFLFVLELAASWAAAGDVEGRTYRQQIERTMPYQLIMPKNYDSQKSYPLVLFLHGAGEMGSNNRAQLIHVVRLFYKDENREKYPCFVVAPQTSRELGGWNGTSLDMVLEILAGLQKEFNIDSKRLYVTGLSMGGFGTWRLLAAHPEMFAAAAPICGYGDPGTAPKIAKVPIWAFHGAADDVVPVQGTRKMIEALKEAGGTPRYTEFPDCKHDSWNLAIQEPDFLSWMFAQKREP